MIDLQSTEIIQNIIKYNNLIDIYKLKAACKKLKNNIPKVPYLRLNVYKETIELYKDSSKYMMKLDTDIVTHEILYMLIKNNHADEFYRLYNSNKPKDINTHESRSILFYTIVSNDKSIKMALCLLNDKIFDLTQYFLSAPYDNFMRFPRAALNEYINKHNNKELEILIQKKN